MVSTNVDIQTESSVNRSVPKIKSAHPRSAEWIEDMHIQEIWKAVKNCKNRKAPGKNGMQNILLKKSITNGTNTANKTGQSWKDIFQANEKSVRWYL